MFITQAISAGLTKAGFSPQTRDLSFFQDDYGLKPLDGTADNDDHDEEDEEEDDNGHSDDHDDSDDLEGSEGYEMIEGNDDDMDEQS